MEKQEGWFRTSSIYGYLLVKIALAWLTLLACQFVFYIANTEIFHVATFKDWMSILWGNVVFGLATVSAALLPYLLLMLIPGSFRWNKVYRKVCELLYWVGTMCIVVAIACDAAYYQHTYRQLSDEIFRYMTIGGQMGTLTGHFIVDFWYSALTIVAFGVLHLVLSNKIKLPQRSDWRKHGANDWVGFAVGCAVVFIMLRGGFYKQSIALSDAARYCEPKNSALVSNSLYSIIRTIGVSQLPEDDYMGADEARQIFDSHFCPMTAPDSTLGAPNNSPFQYAGGVWSDSVLSADSTRWERVTRRKNIMIIELESFSQEYMGCYGAETSYTPFLDSLAQHSTVYQGRSNGKKSIESVPAVSASLPTLTYIPYTMSKYYDSTMVTLPQLLKKHGYSTAFMHGTYNGVMQFDRYCAHAGYDRYYGKNEYMEAGGKEADYDGSWGIFDEPFLQYACEETGKLQEPFFNMTFSVTSHHPFPLPKEYKERFKGGKHPILKCIQYTDYALQQFFAAAKEEAWYKNTLFIILGDHPGYKLSREQSGYGEMYKIPMIVFDPSNDRGMISTRIVQQTDLMPTLIDYLALGEDCTAFGSSIVQHPSEGFGVQFANGYYILERGSGRTAILSGSHEFGAPDDINFLKAYLQQYSQYLNKQK